MLNIDKILQNIMGPNSLRRDIKVRRTLDEVIRGEVAGPAQIAVVRPSIARKGVLCRITRAGVRYVHSGLVLEEFNRMHRKCLEEVIGKDVLNRVTLGMVEPTNVLV